MRTVVMGPVTNGSRVKLPQACCLDKNRTARKSPVAPCGDGRHKGKLLQNSRHDSGFSVEPQRGGGTVPAARCHARFQQGSWQKENRIESGFMGVHNARFSSISLTAATFSPKNE